MASSEELKMVLEQMEKLNKSVNDSLKRTEENGSQIKSNCEDISDLKSKSSLTEAKQEAQSARLDECLARIEALETKQAFFKRADDQDRKIDDLKRKISREEMIKASCIAVLHGLPLPKKIGDMDINDRADIDSIAKILSNGLGKEAHDFIFNLNPDGEFTNMSAWGRIPDNDNFKYPLRTPETAKNSIGFFFRNRIQAIHFESKIRGALISSQAARKSNDFAHLEIGTYAESPRVRALKGLLLYKGRMLVENVPQFAKYRVVWRGGARRDAQEPADLILELKASKDFMEGEKRSFFFGEDGGLLRNPWTDQKNIKLSDVNQTWFAKIPEANQRAVISTNEATNEKRSIKRPRDSPGTSGNPAKNPHEFSCQVVSCAQIFRSRAGLNEHSKTEHKSDKAEDKEDDEDDDNEDPDKIVEVESEILNNSILAKLDSVSQVKGKGEDDGFKNHQGRKARRTIERKEKNGVRNIIPQKIPLQIKAQVPDLQKKITSFASTAEKLSLASSSSFASATAFPKPKLK